MEIMKNDPILEKLLAKRRGSYVRFSMKTHVDGTAKAKAAGANIDKFTTTTARIGVRYASIKGVVPSGRGADWFHWEVPNVVLVHNDTNVRYINFATTPNSNTKTIWTLDGEVVTPEELVEKGYLTNSMAAPKHSPIMRVTLSNIYRVK